MCPDAEKGDDYGQYDEIEDGAPAAAPVAVDVGKTPRGGGAPGEVEESPSPCCSTYDVSAPPPFRDDGRGAASPPIASDPAAAAAAIVPTAAVTKEGKGDDVVDRRPRGPCEHGDAGRAPPVADGGDASAERSTRSDSAASNSSDGMPPSACSRRRFRERQEREYPARSPESPPAHPDRPPRSSPARSLPQADEAHGLSRGLSAEDLAGMDVDDMNYDAIPSRTAPAGAGSRSRGYEEYDARFGRVPESGFCMC